jgi:hypothetical protein
MDFDIIIYSGGKTGSLTLSKTFLNMNYNVLHVHNNEDFLNSNMYNDLRKYNFKTIQELILSQTKNKIYVIDSYRDPIERLISSFFQNIKYYIGDNYLNIDPLLFNHFIFKNLNLEKYHPLNEEYPILRDIPFKYKYIYRIIDRIHYINLRFKDIKLWGIYLSEIFGNEIIIENDNLSENKEYHSLYENFKKIFKIPRSFLEKIKNDFCFQKYNSIEEQESYIKLWSKKCVDDFYFTNILNEIKYINVPKNFNAHIYKFYNSDIISKYPTNEESKIHYELYGYKEDRIYKVRILTINTLDDLKFDYSGLDVTSVMFSLKKDNIINFIYKYYNCIFGCSNDFGILKITQNDKIITIKENTPLIIKFKKYIPKKYYIISLFNECINHPEIIEEYIKKYEKKNIILIHNLDEELKFPNLTKIRAKNENEKQIIINNIDINLEDDITYVDLDKIYEIIEIPESFEYYRLNNSDLIDMNENQLLNHYINYGCNENRNVFNLLPEDFNPEEYRNLNEDLIKFNNDEVKFHYIKYGYYEKRIYKINKPPHKIKTFKFLKI